MFFGNRTNAFVVRPFDSSISRQKLASTILSATSDENIDNKYNKPPLTDMDSMIIMNAADYCLYQDECSLEDKDALIRSLQKQRQSNANEADILDILVKRLRHSRDSTPASQEHIETLTKSMELVMNNMEVCNPDVCST